MSNNNFADEYYYMRHPDGAYASIVESKGSAGYPDEKGEFIENPEMMIYHFSKYSQVKNKVRDYVYAESDAVVSQKVYDAIAPLNIQGIQLLPAIIEGSKSNIEGYYYIHIVNHYAVLDLDKSICDWNDFIEVASPIEKIVLKDDVISNIPLNERLVFYLEENNQFQFFHQTVVDAVMAANPDGLMFYKVSEYGKGTYWK